MSVQDDASTSDERVYGLPAVRRAFGVEEFVTFGFAVCVISIGFLLAADGLQPYFAASAWRAFVLAGVNIAVGVLLPVAAWWAVFWAGDRGLRRVRVTAAGLIGTPVYGRSSINVPWAEVKTLVLAHRNEPRRTTAMLRIQRAGHGRWLAVSADVPDFAELIGDVRRRAPQATYRDTVDRRVIWRRYLLQGVIAALSLVSIVYQVVNPSDSSPVSVALSVVVIVLMIGPVIWTHAQRDAMSTGAR